MGRLDGKVAVITGAASGMGRATAARFAGEGASVVIADLNAEGGEAAVRDCKENGGNAIFQHTDVTSEAAIKAAIDRAVKEYGKLDIMFNNAGLAGALGSLEETTVENWDRTFAILLRGVFLGIKYSIPAMRKAGGGSIISTASVAGLRGGAGPLPYSVAKAGVVHLTKCAAIDLRAKSHPRQLHLSRRHQHAAHPSAHPGRRTGRAATPRSDSADSAGRHR